MSALSLRGIVATVREMLVRGGQVNGQKLTTVTSFKYLGSFITDEGSKPEILSRIAQTIAELTRLKPVWNDRSISLSSKI